MEGAITDAYRGTVVARILNGEKPSDFPVQQSTKCELIINRKTANAPGLTISLALTGDRVSPPPYNYATAHAHGKFSTL